jgi:hypothetical protein
VWPFLAGSAPPSPSLSTAQQDQTPRAQLNNIFYNELLVPTAVHGMHDNTADMILTIDPFDALKRPAEDYERLFLGCDPHPLDDPVPFKLRRHRGCVQCSSGTWCEKQCSL